MVLMVEIWAKHADLIQPPQNRQSLRVYIAPITDITILETELSELEKVKDRKSLKEPMEYLSFFKQELDYFIELSEHYKKSDVIFNNNVPVSVDKDFKRLVGLIRKQLRRIIKILEN